jgi:hypothetical protein
MNRAKERDMPTTRDWPKPKRHFLFTDHDVRPPGKLD